MDHSVDSAAESSVDRKLQEIFGLTDEMMLAEFEAAEKDTRGLPIPPRLRTNLRPSGHGSRKTPPTLRKRKPRLSESGSTGGGWPQSG